MKRSPSNMNPFSDLAQKIDRAWELRIHDEIENCLTAVSELFTLLDLPANAVEDVTELELPSNQSEALQVLVLSASLRRREPASDRWLKEIETWISRHKVSSVTFLDYERGIRFLDRGDSYPAIDCFQRLAAKGSSDFQRMLGNANSIICLENLGLDYGRRLGELELILERAGTQYTLTRVKSQIAGLRLREAFRRGEFGAIEKTALSTRSFDQPAYLRLWLASLPYHRYRSPAVARELEPLIEGLKQLNHSAYRLRTLQLFFHPSDGVEYPSEFCDRLYLWVWMWLFDEKEMPLERVSLLLENCGSLETHRLTLEDTFLLRNALSWLALFDPLSEARLASFLGRLNFTKAACDFSLLVFEYELIQYLRAWRDQDDRLARECLLSLQRSASWSNPDLFFREIAQGLGELGHIRNKLRSPDRHDGAPQIVIVDLTTMTVRQAGKTLAYSEAVCHAIELLGSQANVSCATLCNVCFGIRKYEPLVHEPKVYALLQRMKQILRNKVTLSVRQGVVFSEGDWSGIEFHRPYSIAGILRCLPTAPSASSASDMVAWVGEISRADLEARLGRPRSTVNRFLSKWLSEGRIAKIGRGKQVRYRWSMKT